jgi:uncharacterized membrane protein
LNLYFLLTIPDCSVPNSVKEYQAFVLLSTARRALVTYSAVSLRRKTTILATPTAISSLHSGIKGEVASALLFFVFVNYMKAYGLTNPAAIGIYLTEFCLHCS